MNPSRMDVSQFSTACSRVFFKPDVSSAATAGQSQSSVRCLSVSTRSPANQSSRGSAARFGSLQVRSSGVPRASSVGWTTHQ